MVDHLDPRYRPIVYDVAMSSQQIHHRAAEASSPVWWEPDSGS
jgi:hypothetical protein